MNPQMIFVFPPAASHLGENISSRFDFCLGGAYIISYLLEKGFRAQPFLAKNPVGITACAVAISRENPKVVGFTVYDANYCLCLLIAQAVKQINPAIIIVFGGPTPSVQAETILKNNSYVDICARHEGEETCFQLLTLLDSLNYNLKRAGDFLDSIKGISFRREELIIENPGREILTVNKDCLDFLDKYPSPYLSGILTSAGLGILTARGCDRHCIYCNCAIIAKRIIVRHSIQRVLDELIYIEKRFSATHKENVAIYDDTFTMDRNRALEICRKIIENKLKLSLVCITRCDTVDEELLDTMKETGFTSIGFSLESSVPHILRKIGKVQPPYTKNDENFLKEREFIEKFRKYTSYAKKIGIKNVFVSIIVGLPGESPEEGQQTVNFVRSLDKDIDYYAHNFFKVYPGTPIFYNHRKYGIKLEQEDNQIHYKTIHAYDTGKIHPAPKSNLEKDNIKKDKLNMKTLALSIPLHSSLKCFNKIVLCTDSINKELVFWLQSCLAVNGPVLHIYSNFEQAKEFHQRDEYSLRKYLSPSTFHMVYYRKEGENGVQLLIPLRIHKFGNPCGITIDLRDTKTGLISSSNELNPLHSLCMDEDMEDVLQLHSLLVDLTEKKKKGIEWWTHKLYPYFSGMCRWRKSCANCRILDTAIIDSNNNIKTCWKGMPVGKVGMPFQEIVKNLNELSLIKETERDCFHCDRQSACTKCIFPAPLSDERYCALKQGSDTGDTAELMQAFNFFKVL